jgi:hypothetical protein
MGEDLWQSGKMFLPHSTFHPRTDMLVQNECMSTDESMLFSIGSMHSITSCLHTASSSRMDRSTLMHSSTASKCDVMGADAVLGGSAAAAGAADGGVPFFRPSLRSLPLGRWNSWLVFSLGDAGLMQDAWHAPEGTALSPFASVTLGSSKSASKQPVGMVRGLP